MGCPTGKVNLFEGDQAVRVGNDEESGFVRVRLSTKPGHLPKVGDEEVVAKDIPWRDDKAALVIGPTGLVLGQNGTLYVGDTLESRIIAIPRAVTRTTALSDRRLTLSSGGRLKQPLGLILAPNGDILTTNAGDGNIVETTPSGHQVATAAGDAKTGAGLPVRARHRATRQESALRRRRASTPCGSSTEVRRTRFRGRTVRRSA